MTTTIPPQIADLISNYGDAGVFVAMFLESSIIPIPSEVVIMAAAAMGIPLVSIVTFGTFGALLGGMVGYAIGRFVGFPVILRFGKYFLITPKRLEKAEVFAKKYGAWGVLFGRLLPIIPFKVFSIASGITRIPFIPFVLFTFLGLVPRMYLLGLFGVFFIKYTKICLLAVAGAGLIAGGVWYIRTSRKRSAWIAHTRDTNG